MFLTTTELPQTCEVSPQQWVGVSAGDRTDMGGRSGYLDIAFTVSRSETYGDRISDAVLALRELAVRVAGDAVVGMTRHTSLYGVDDERPSTAIVLSVQIRSDDVALRLSLMNQLLDFIAEHPDSDVRRDVSIEIT